MCYAARFTAKLGVLPTLKGGFCCFCLMQEAGVFVLDVRELVATLSRKRSNGFQVSDV
jgi:hypothetical protein